jgi:hypothetical protein
VTDPSGVQRIVDESGEIVMDERWFPVLVVTWLDSPGLDAVRRYFEWNERMIDRVRAGPGAYVNITDSLEAHRPSPRVRALVAELTDAMPDDATELGVGNYVVFGSALIRGALTAMQWLSRDPWNITMVASLRQAIERSLDDLEVADVAPPPGLTLHLPRADRSRAL